MKTKQSKFTLFSLFFVALFASAPLFAATELTATVSNNSVVVGDQFFLTVSINDNDDDYQLDTTPLQENFHVSRPSRSQSSEFNNGDFRQRTEWRVRLQAKQSGIFTIPSLQVGNYSSDAIQIRVSDPSQVDQDSMQDELLFIENSINESEIYVGQTLIFTTKLYIAKNSNQLELEAPSFTGADVSVFGEDSSSQMVRNGIRYNTITRQYKLTANQAGQFEISSPLLTGTIRKVVGVNKWQNRVVPEPINIRGQRLSVNVKPIPADYQGEWLVSEDLRLFEESDLTAQQYRVGEPITRRITLQVASLDKDKLPSIKFNYPSSLRMYPDQDQLQEGEAGGLSYAVRTMSHAIIADSPGTLTLPEISLNWFNSHTNKVEVARLPEQHLTILPAEQTIVNTLPETVPVTPAIEQQVIVDHQALIYWQITVALLLLIMVLMVIYHLHYRRTLAIKKPSTAIQATVNESQLALRKSLQNHDAPKCYSLLLKCAQEQYPSLRTLAELPTKSALDEQKRELLKHELQWLQICCSDQTQQWNGHKLAELLRLNDAQKTAKTETDPMNLNP